MTNSLETPTYEFTALNQILQNLDTVNANWDSTTGGVIIYTERESCESCLWVKAQFEGDYPEIKLTFLDGQNNIII